MAFLGDTVLASENDSTGFSLEVCNDDNYACLVRRSVHV